MNMIIAGAGMVGATLTRVLSAEGHDVTLIDSTSSVLNNNLEQYDVMGIQGNCASMEILQEAGVMEAELLIAATNLDEVNLLCCLIAKKAGNCNTIARVRTPEYVNETNYLREELGLSMVINPELTCARGISHLIEIPSALDFTTFAKGRANMIELSIPEGSVIHGMTVIDFAKKINSKTLICCIERGGEVIIPDGNTILCEKDRMYVIIPPSELHSLLSKIGIKAKPIKNVLIAGGSKVAYYLTKCLEEARIQVKIIERDFKSCERLSELLPHTLVIHGDATNRQLLLEEGIENMDAFVSLTNMDEENMLLSLFANKVSQAKIITKIDKISFEEVINELPIGTIACPKNITAKSIIQYVRGVQNSFGSNVETLYRVLDDKVEAIEFKVNQCSKVTGKPLMDLNLKKNLLVCAIFRNGKIITPTGRDTIENGDRVLIITANKGLADLTDILA